MKFEPIIVAGQHKVFVRSHDNLMWILEPNTHDGFGPHHAEQEPVGHSVHDYIMGLIHKTDGQGVFLDIGAHVGHYTLRAARRCAHVYAVEANPATSARLLENLTLNKFTNVTLLAVAAWDAPGVLHLAYGTSEEVRSGGMRVLEEDTGVGIQVPSATVDSLALPAVDVVKIDTEGAEIAILTGMISTISRCRPLLIVENHAYLGYYQHGDLLAAEKEISKQVPYTWHDIKEFGVQSLAGDKGLNYRIGKPGDPHLL